MRDCSALTEHPMAAGFHCTAHPPFHAERLGVQLHFTVKSKLMGAEDGAVLSPGVTCLRCGCCCARHWTPPSRGPGLWGCWAGPGWWLWSPVSAEPFPGHCQSTAVPQGCSRCGQECWNASDTFPLLCCIQQRLQHADPNWNPLTLRKCFHFVLEGFPSIYWSVFPNSTEIMCLI